MGGIVRDAPHLHELRLQGDGAATDLAWQGGCAGCGEVSASLAAPSHLAVVSEEIEQQGGGS